MLTLIDQGIIWIAVCFLIGKSIAAEQLMIYMLTGIILICFTYVTCDLKKSRAEVFFYYILTAACCLIIGAEVFLPFVWYAFAYKYDDRRQTKIGYFLFSVLSVVLNVKLRHGSGGIRPSGISEFASALRGSVQWFFAMLGLLAVYMAVKSKRNRRLEESIKHFRDDSREKTYLLEAKNKSLLTNQEKEVKIAVLSERNRIAREMHDNVGHLLSRSILQMGAILSINKDERSQVMLRPVLDTLNEAMNSVRESVHDLHKESFDIENAARAILEDLKGFRVHFECDISMDADKEIKYAFLAILKEAVNNIMKYCDGDEVQVVMRELDEYYQMVIEDNGVAIRTKPSVVNGEGRYETGIGLVNMQDRVRSMSGLINISQEQGMRIFISVPKNTE